MFAKYWKPGTVKTRLAAALGPAAAAEIYRCFLASLADTFARIADRRVIYYSPTDQREAFESLAADAWAVAPQQGADLGLRMRQYFDEAFVAGAERVVLIGSDSPQLTAETVESAFTLLADQDVVLGPSDDGGYYLVGARNDTPPIFTEIDWSTPQVYAQSVERIKQANLKYAPLPESFDVDTIDDLNRLRLLLAKKGDTSLGRAIDRVLKEKTKEHGA